jgi:NADH-quinone oxidoreductase subunit H
VLWFFGKVLAFIFFFIWLRGTLPRLRYDQFMAFGWKRLIPIALVWIVAVAGIRAASNHGGFDRTWLYVAIGVLAGLVLVLGFVDDQTTRARERAEEAELAEQLARPFDAFAGGYPVPPMDGPAIAGPAPAYAPAGNVHATTAATGSSTGTPTSTTPTEES